MASSKEKYKAQGSRATLKYVRLSPTKARLVAKQIQGLNAEIALAMLEFTPNKAAKLIYKTVASAIANGNYEASNVEILSCRVDRGPVLKRFMPRARGRATPIRKPMSHIFVEVGESDKSSQKENKKTSISKFNKKEQGEVDNGSKS